MATHRLVPVETEREWDAYHAIRQHVLFELRGRFGVYDRTQPDERLPANHPLLLFLADRPIGVVRVDLDPPIAYFRRVAVIPELQRMGHGTVMLGLAERFVLEAGCDTVLSNVDVAAVPFYEHRGFGPDPDRVASPSVAMIKRLDSSDVKMSQSTKSSMRSPSAIRGRGRPAWVCSNVDHDALDRPSATKRS